MAYQRTGRPPGRPKTRHYVTLMARVPQDLADQAKRYAGLHRQTMSDLLRDGLLLVLQDDDPHRAYVSDTNTVQEIMYDKKPLSAHDTPEMVSDSNTREEIMSDGNTLSDRGAPEIVPDVNRAPGIVSDTIGYVPELVATPYNPDVAHARMRELQGQGRSQRQIAAQLTAEGIPTRHGKPWDQSSVHYLLHKHQG